MKNLIDKVCTYISSVCSTIKSKLFIFLSQCLDKKNISTFILTTLCLLFFLPSVFISPVTFGGNDYSSTNTEIILSSLFYSFSHINIFHLLINIIALVQFRPRITTTLVAFAIAVAVSILRVAPNPIPTCGISVLLYAAIARNYVAWNKPIYIPLLSNVFLCGINFLLSATVYNWLAHILAFSISYIIWYVYYRYIKKA